MKPQNKFQNTNKIKQLDKKIHKNYRRIYQRNNDILNMSNETYIKYDMNMNNIITKLSKQIIQKNTHKQCMKSKNITTCT